MLRGLRIPAFVLLTALALTAGASRALATGTATGIAGLYYTGDQKNSSTLATQGSTDGNWTVTYASTNGGSSTATQYEGKAYVVTDSSISGSGYVQDTSSAQWITAPGAATDTSGDSKNTGGLYLPGNGDSGSNAGFYIYTLAFTISGTGSGTVTNDVAISLTIAADDDYYVFVNPTTSTGAIDPGTSIPSSTASAIGDSAWNNTTAISLANYTSSTQGFTDNANFVIGTNYLVIGVINSNGVTGTSSSTALNASGLLVYQVGNLGFINGKPIPEMHTWLPMALATLLGACVLVRRRSLQA